MIRLGRIGGVEVIADVWVLVVAGVLGWLQSVTLDRFDPGAFVGVLGVVAAVGYVVSLLLHEAAHSELARYRHLRPRRIRLLVFGGFTSIDEREVRPTDEYWIALAGPVVSLVAGGAVFGMSLIPGIGDGVADTLRLLGVINIVLALFNLLPGLPLDGGRALHGVLWKTSGDRVRATVAATVAGRALGIVAVGIGLVLLVVFADLGGFVLLVLGWFLYWSATAAGKREELVARAEGSTAADIMRPTRDAVPGSMRVAEVAALFQVGPTLRALPVEVDGRVRGVIGQAELDDLAPARRELGRAASVMTPIGPDDLVDADVPVEVVAARLTPEGRLLVVENGVVVGLIEHRDLLETLGG
jgi:Zn-dependent protease/CBS domain-containing protein